ncbi:hypothetical protein [Synechococcus sp. CBW1107]|uniref:hypothetical protein n=1 Tax=Synechococcus sp. CBW1107 TaxID=2789857 RepID=UPI002AD40E20|nr:hypothetical protein [Synechococcus sp. CBW1107]CAK6687528.1 hypothetical protein MNNICLKF_00235 [Synechococcus sp. CBW1107]
MRSFESKRFLFVAPPFFGYHTEIINEIESQGGYVDWIPDRPFDSSFGKAFARFLPQFAAKNADLIYRRLLNTFGSTSYDYVFVINGQTLSRSFLTALKHDFSSAYFVLYLWDSVANRSHILRNFYLFDRVLSFDPSDVSFYGLTLRPLFYGRQYVDSRSNGTFSFDLSFVGSVHSDRYQVVNRLKLALPSMINSFFFLYIQSLWLFYFYRCYLPGMRSASLNEFSFKPLSSSKLSKTFACSRSILDIAHPHQSGLTMRTFETLGAHKKLITTNSSVREYDFYDERNIAVIDRCSPIVDPDFLSTDFSPPESSIMDKYSVSAWIHEVIY